MELETKQYTFEEREALLEDFRCSGKRIVRFFKKVSGNVQNNTFKPLKEAILQVEAAIDGWERSMRTADEVCNNIYDRLLVNRLSDRPVPGVVHGGTQTTCVGNCPCASKIMEYLSPGKPQSPQVEVTAVAVTRPKEKGKEKKENKKKEKVAKPPPPPLPTPKRKKKKEAPPKASEPEFTLVTRRKLKPKPLKKDEEKRTEKNKPNKKPQKRLPPAVEVRPAGGITPNEIITMIKDRIDPSNCETDIRRIRVTGRGQVLVEIAEEDRDKAIYLEKAITAALGEGSSVKTLGANMLLEVRDLDVTTTAEELSRNIASAVSCQQADVQVRWIHAAFQGTKTALIEVKNEEGGKLLAAKTVRIGWSSCHIRPHLQLTRCYRCTGYGHTAHHCRGPDRSNLCRVCNRPGHKAAACNGEPECVQCKEAGYPHKHPQGSYGSCTVFRRFKEKKAAKMKRKDVSERERR